jgi:hypothetical protein
MHIHAYMHPYMHTCTHSYIYMHVFMPADEFDQSLNQSSQRKHGPTFTVHDYTHDKTYTQFGGRLLVSFYVYVSIHMSMYLCVYAYMHTYANWVCTCTYMHTYANYVCQAAYTWACVSVCVYIYIYTYIHVRIMYVKLHKRRLYVDCLCLHKADCVWVGCKILEAKGKSRSTTFVQRGKRNFQTAQNGVSPSVAIFAGQLKRNQLYMTYTHYGGGLSFVWVCICAKIHVDTHAWGSYVRNLGIFWRCCATATTG